MSKQVVLTGLRANNSLHIGNYLGALLPLIKFANENADKYQINLFVPDLHSFTTTIDYKQLNTQVMQTLRIFVALGLNIEHPDIHIYRQSRIPAHSELTVILNNFVQFGHLSRMTQFKDKSNRKNGERQIRGILEPVANAKSPKEIEPTTAHKLLDLISKLNDFQDTSVGLFDYPVLMAADILLYNAVYVPVGDDQKQHLEFTRDIAENFNKKFGNIFVLPKKVEEQNKFFGQNNGLRIRDLVDPNKKMSKSDDTGKGVIFLSDKPDVASKKIMSSTTDSVGNVARDYEHQPGITNLLDILDLMDGDSKQYIGSSEYGKLKKAVADVTSEFLINLGSKLNDVDDNKIEQKLIKSEAIMKAQADKCLVKVQQSVGLK